MQQSALRSDDADFAVRHFDALSVRSEVVAAIAAAGNPYPLASRHNELPYHGWRDGLLPATFEDHSRSLGSLGKPSPGRRQPVKAAAAQRWRGTRQP
ncbi:MAG TPA: hypothetical protein VG942_19275 [Hyphomonadaceae bacterium]|nr:hypothetical protein [Hyphomonadaceae bacterium]